MICEKIVNRGQRVEQKDLNRVILFGRASPAEIGIISNFIYISSPFSSQIYFLSRFFYRIIKKQGWHNKKFSRIRFPAAYLWSHIYLKISWRCRDSNLGPLDCAFDLYNSEGFLYCNLISLGHVVENYFAFFLQCSFQIRNTQIWTLRFPIHSEQNSTNITNV